jgi:hypothetical protein
MVVYALGDARFVPYYATEDGSVFGSRLLGVQNAEVVPISFSAEYLDDENKSDLLAGFVSNGSYSAEHRDGVRFGIQLYNGANSIRKIDVPVLWQEGRFMADAYQFRSTRGGDKVVVVMGAFMPNISAIKFSTGITLDLKDLESISELTATGKGDMGSKAKQTESQTNQRKEIRFPKSGFPAWKFTLPDGWEVVPADKGSFRIMNAAKTGSIDVNATDLVTQSKLESAIVDFLEGADFDVRKRNSSKIAGRDGFKYNKVIKSPDGADLNLELSMVVIENRYLLNRIVFTGVRHPDEMEFHKVAETMQIVDK